MSQVMSNDVWEPISNILNLPSGIEARRMTVHLEPYKAVQVDYDSITPQSALPSIRPGKAIINCRTDCHAIGLLIKSFATALAAPGHWVEFTQPNVPGGDLHALACDLVKESGLKLEIRPQDFKLFVLSNPDGLQRGHSDPARCLPDVPK